MRVLPWSWPSFLLAVPLLAQGPGTSPSGAVPLAPPGVRCTVAEAQAAARADSAWEDATPPVPKGRQQAPVVRGLPPGEQRTTLLYVVDATGRVDPCSIRVVNETARAFTIEVMQVVLEWRFRPARVGDRPVRFAVQQSIVGRQP